MSRTAREAVAIPAPAGSVARLLDAYSVEVTPHSRGAVEACRAALSPGTAVYLAAVPGRPQDAMVTAAAALGRAGFEPVPHIAARAIEGRAHLDALLARLTGEAGVIKALVIAGDLDRAAGPYASSLELLQTGLFGKRGIRELGFACYPEPHRKIGEAALREALAAKLAFARGAGIEPWLVTQFGFEAGPILQCVRRLRMNGIAVPVRIGIAGPATRRTLLKYAIHCGIGNSIRALGTQFDAIDNLLSRDSPDRLVADLAAGAADDPTLGIEGLHIFTFGGVTAAARWAKAIAAMMN